jgi:hypothetical protein
VNREESTSIQLPGSGFMKGAFYSKTLPHPNCTTAWTAISFLVPATYNIGDSATEQGIGITGRTHA